MCIRDSEEAIEILEKFKEISEFKVEPIASGGEVLKIRDMIWNVYVDRSVSEYIVDLVEETRKHPHVKIGGSPRAAIALYMASRAMALMNGRDYVIPDDVKAVAHAVLNHRLILKPESEFEGITPAKVIEEVVKSVPVP